MNNALHDLEEYLKNCSTSSCPEFSRLTSIAILSSVLAPYQIESFRSNLDPLALNLYLLLCANTGSGKNSFIESLRRCIQEIAPELVTSMPPSQLGLRIALNRFHVRTILCDEAAYNLKALTHPNSAYYIRMLESDIKQVYSNQSVLVETLSGSTFIKSVREAHLSIFLMTQTNIIKKVLNPYFLESGLIGRFLVGISGEPKNNQNEKKPVFPKKAISHISDLYSQIRNSKPLSKEIDFFKTTQKKTLEQRIYFKKTKPILWKKEAKNIAFEFDINCQNENPLAARLAVMAAKIAGLHCLGRYEGERFVLKEDIEFGIEVVRKSYQNASSLFSQPTKKLRNALSVEEKIVRRLSTEAFGLSRRQILQNLHLTVEEYEEALKNLSDEVEEFRNDLSGQRQVRLINRG